MAPAHVHAGAFFMLSDGQRRHVAVFLSRLEEGLDDIERLATQPAPDGRVLVRERADLPPQYHDAIRDDLLGLREDVRALARALDLPPRERSRARQVRALLGTLLVQLEDARARSLRAYGVLDPAEGGRLDGALEAIHGRLERLLDRLSRSDPAGVTP
jgi:hypothetical protein